MITRVKVFGTRRKVIADVKFNEDLTLLYGINGSGKTTLLNLVAAVSTGQVDALSTYEFGEIHLQYRKHDTMKSIRVKVLDDGNYQVTFNGKAFVVNPSVLRERKMDFGRRGRTVHPSEYLTAELREVAAEIPLTYLPLSRDSSLFDNIFPREAYRASEIEAQVGLRLYNESFLKTVRTVDDSLEYVKVIVKESHRRMMLKLDSLNADLRQRMFETSLTMQYDSMSFETALKNSMQWDKKTIGKLKAALEGVGLLTPTFEKEIDTAHKRFMDSLQIVMTMIKEELQEKAVAASASPTATAAASENTLPVQEESKSTQPIGLVLASYQFERLGKWQALVEEANAEKVKALRPMNAFMDTINSFFKDSGKKLTFDSAEGALAFTITKDDSNAYPLHKLSSGEKQLVIFFAYLFFSRLYKTDIDEKSGSIFVIDEPELSLHVAWQRRFTKAVLTAAPDLQLVFATHSPEIIGPFRGNCVEVKWRGML